MAIVRSTINFTFHPRLLHIPLLFLGRRLLTIMLGLGAVAAVLGWCADEVVARIRL